MHSVETSPVSQRGFVSTVHVLTGGEIIYSLQDFLKIESRFSWVDKNILSQRFLNCRKKRTIAEDPSSLFMKMEIRSVNT